MTDKLKCCFCGSELEQCFENMPDLACSNYECDYATIPLPPKVWQALIFGKKTQDAIQKIKDIVHTALQSIGQRLDGRCNCAHI